MDRTPLVEAWFNEIEEALNTLPTNYQIAYSLMVAAARSATHLRSMLVMVDRKQRLPVEYQKALLEKFKKKPRHCDVEIGHYLFNTAFDCRHEEEQYEHHDVLSVWMIARLAKKRTQTITFSDELATIHLQGEHATHVILYAEWEGSTVNLEITMDDDQVFLLLDLNTDQFDEEHYAYLRKSLCWKLNPFEQYNRIHLVFPMPEWSTEEWLSAHVARGNEYPFRTMDVAIAKTVVLQALNEKGIRLRRLWMR